MQYETTYPYETGSKRKSANKKMDKKIRKFIFIFSCKIYRNCFVKVTSHLARIRNFACIFQGFCQNFK